MKRLPRTILIAATIVSLVLCVVTAAAWVRSYWCVANLDLITGPPQGKGVALGRGEVVFSETHQPNARHGWHFAEFRLSDEPVPPTRSITVLPGIERGGRPGYSQYVSLSFAYPLAAFAALPAMRAACALRGRRRSRLDLCPTCGYDLRASPTRCPECGTFRPPASTSV